MSTASSSANHHHHHHQQQNSASSAGSNQFYVPRNVSESVIQNLDGLITATNVAAVLQHQRQIARLLRFDETNSGGGIGNFFRLKGVLFAAKSLSKWNRVAAILKALDKKAAGKEYAGVRPKLAERRILVIGGGLSGLRAAIECLLIGAKVVCVEKRAEFSRNNVIHLWPNVIQDLYSFEGKRLYGQFCVGSIDHVSIRQLQLMLLKIAVILGVSFVPSVGFDELCPRIIEPQKQCRNHGELGPGSCGCCCHTHGFGGGAYAHFSSQSNSSIASELTRIPFDVIIGCDGMRNTFSRYFPRNSRRGKLAIGLTANYVNRRTEEEAHCAEISGISRIYNQQWFKDLSSETGIELENIVYYRDETHYFVMTATKGSLLKRGVLRADFGDSHQLLSNSNIDISALMRYSKDAAEWSSKLRRLDFALNSSGKPDVALFDFTAMYSATNASCAKRIYLNCCNGACASGEASTAAADGRSSRYALMLLCGDSLLEPFWPTGSGAGRGLLSALDAAWAVSLWYGNIRNDSSESADLETMLNVISRREYVYRLLAQTNPENTTAKGFTLDPATRYKNLNLRDSRTLTEIRAQVRHLIIDRPDLDRKTYVSNYETSKQRARRRATVAINPEDVLKASELTSASYKAILPYNGLDGLSRTKPIYAVPQSPYSSSSARQRSSSNLNCDSGAVPNFEVIERKPKNTAQEAFEHLSSSLYGLESLTTSASSSDRPVSPRGDFKPRNSSVSGYEHQEESYLRPSEQQPQRSSSFKKDYQARNHLILNANNEANNNNFEQTNSTESFIPRIRGDSNNNKENKYARIPPPSEPQTRSSYYGGLESTASSFSQKKANAPKNNGSSLHEEPPSTFTDPTSKLYDFGGFDDRTLHQLSEAEAVEKAAGGKPYSWASRAAFLRDFAERNSRRHEDHPEGSTRSGNKKTPASSPKKTSSDIIEKAQYLEAKFEEHKKPYQPTLSKVGKIEDEDWNVKIWNSEEIFAPKIAERRNMVHDNSKALLQSRINQLHNNFSAKDDILLRAGELRKNRSSGKVASSGAYVNMLSNEVASKFSSKGTAANRLTSASSKTPGEQSLASVGGMKAKNCVALARSDSTDYDQLKHTSGTTTGSLKTAELLKPLGECKRCCRGITAIDRVAVRGHNYHRTCLTCKVCSIMLRQEELLSEEFICRLCRSSSRSGNANHLVSPSASLFFPSSSFAPSSAAPTRTFDNSSRSSFFTDHTSQLPLSVSLIEAKKNFLVNVEQIDLRERAEFEIMDELAGALAKEEESVVQLETQAPDAAEEEEEGGEGQSDLSESDDPAEGSYSSSAHSDTNYTDDEQSESDAPVVPLDDLPTSKKEVASITADVGEVAAIKPEDEDEFAALMFTSQLLNETSLTNDADEEEEKEEGNKELSGDVIETYSQLERQSSLEVDVLDVSTLPETADFASPTPADLAASTDQIMSTMKKDKDAFDAFDASLLPSEPCLPTTTTSEDSNSDGPPSPAPPLPPLDGPPSPPSLMTRSTCLPFASTEPNLPSYHAPYRSYHSYQEQCNASNSQEAQPSSLVLQGSSALPNRSLIYPTSYSTLDSRAFGSKAASRSSSGSSDVEAKLSNWRTSHYLPKSKRLDYQTNTTSGEDRKRPQSGKLPSTRGVAADKGDGDNEVDGSLSALPPRYRYSGAFTEKFYRTLSQPTLYEQLQHIDRKLKSAVLPPPSSHDLPFADGGGGKGVASASAEAPVASIEDV